MSLVNHYSPVTTVHYSSPVTAVHYSSLSNSAYLYVAVLLQKPDCTVITSLCNIFMCKPISSNHPPPRSQHSTFIPHPSAMCIVIATFAISILRTSKKNSFVQTTTSYCSAAIKLTNNEKRRERFCCRG